MSRTLLLMACCASSALGQAANSQTYPKIEYFAGYSAIETTDHSFHFSEIGTVSGLDFDEQGRGFETEVIGNLSRYFSLVGDFSAHLSYNQFPAQFCKQHPCPASETQMATIDPRLFDFLAGPEVKWRNHTRITPFANALFGLGHSSATFNTAGSLLNLSTSDAESGFAMAFHTGFDLRIKPRVSFRGFITYGQDFVGSSALPRQRVDAVGWSAGVLFH
jgi:hypothetical protein